MASGLTAHLRVRDEGDALHVRFGPIPLLGTRVPYDQIESAEPSRTSWWHGWGVHGWPGAWLVFNLWGYGAVTLHLKEPRGLLRFRRYIVGTDEPEKLAAFLRAKVGEAARGSVSAREAALQRYQHREFSPLGVPFWVVTVGLAVLLYLRRDASGFPAELINTLLGIGACAFGAAALSTSYLLISGELTDLLVSYGPLPFVRVRLPYRLMENVEKSWMDFFRVAWGALPGQPRCFIGRGSNAVRVTFSQRHAAPGHISEIFIGTDEPERLEEFLRVRIGEDRHGREGSQA